MKRFLLSLVACLIPTFAMAANHDVHGYTLGDNAHLEDSILGPGAPIAITWDVALNGWKGTGNGVTYHVVKEGADWKIRAILPAGDFALAWSLVAYPGQDPTITSPVFRDAAGGGSGPLMARWGNVGKVTIKLTP